MKHRLPLVLAILVAAATALVATASGTGRGQLYTFSGSLLAAPGENATSVSVSVESGNKPALRALIGQSQNEVFSLDSHTQILVWSHGVAHVSSSAALNLGDYVSVNLRASGGSSLQEILSHPAASVTDRQSAPNANKPLWLFSGTVAGPQSGGKINLHVGSGNWKALQSMLGQSLDQTFSYNDDTIFLLWQGRTPTVIDASQLKAGDRISVRIRALRSSSLAQVESVPANHVGDHEPPPLPLD